MAGERLQKVLARAGVASRRKAEQLVRDGRVQVNGHVVVEQGVRVDPERDAIEVDGRRIKLEELVYILLHKPREVVSTMSDPQGRATVADHIGAVGARVVPVGRLDYQTSGALVMTNDGQLCRALLHPSQGVLKLYSLKVRGVVDERGLVRFRSSIPIEGSRTRPARVTLERVDGDRTWLSIEVHEGKNRQIRRLAEHAGYPVMRLSRVRFAGLSVEGLAPGKWRHLTRDEVASLRRQVQPRP